MNNAFTYQSVEPRQNLKLIIANFTSFITILQEKPNYLVLTIITDAIGIVFAILSAFYILIFGDPHIAEDEIVLVAIFLLITGEMSWKSLVRNVIEKN